VQALARAGFTVPETARALAISINTVKQYRALLLRRKGMP
jgi:DNA-binding CsgD family transcriptional regulator